MRRRICLVGTAVGASSLALAGLATAAGKPGAPKVKPVILRCSMSLSTVPPAGSASVDQPPAQGNQYGALHCGRRGFGGGLARDSFHVPDSGDTVGRYAEYFHAGSIAGKFDLVPNEGAPLSATNFTSQTWLGKVTITGGTGIYKGIRSRKGSGRMTCTSPDAVHLSCHEKIKVLLPAGV